MRRAAKPLTDRRIAAVKPPASGDVKLRDALTPGLVFRVRASGRREWVYCYTFGGRRREAALGEHGSKPPALTLEAARVRAGRMRAALREGRDPLEAREAERQAALERAEAAKRAKREAEARRRAQAKGEPLPGTFGDLCRRYLREHARKRKRTWREDARKIERELLPAWSKRPPGEITRGDVRALVVGIAEGEGQRARPGAPAPASANRTLALVSRIFAFGLDVEYPGIVANPAYRLARPGVERPRERVLSEAEIRALWAATEAEGPQARAAFRLLMLAGLRRGELLGARWRDLAEDDLGLWLEVPGDRTKTGRPLRAPLSTLAREVLAELAEAPDPELIFPGAIDGRPLGDLKGPLRRLRARVLDLTGEAGALAEPWTVHDLRRTFRTLLAGLRVPFGIAERLLGHVAPEARGVGGIYDRHLYAEERMAAVEALARKVRAIVTGESGNVLPFSVERAQS